jgi:hypothetical protein
MIYQRLWNNFNPCNCNTQRVSSMKTMIIMTIMATTALALGMEVVVAVVVGAVVEMMIKNTLQIKTTRN